MSTKQQKHQAEKLQKRKGEKFTRRSLFVITVISLALAITIIWILNSQGIIQGSLAPNLSIVFTVLGIVIALFQWLLPVSSTQPETYSTEQQTSSIATQQTPPEQINSHSLSVSNASTPKLPGPENNQQITLDASDDQKPIVASLSTQPDSAFCFNVNLPKPDEFYGRESERITLINRTSNKASTSIIGERRIGKTWLIEYLMLVARTKLGSRFRFGYLNAYRPGCATVIGFTTLAAKELGVILTPDQAYSGLNALEKVVEDFKSRKQVPVLCIDEFEGIGNKHEFGLEFFAGLRALAQRDLALVVASKRPLIDIIGEYGNSSGLFNIFEQLTIEPFDIEEAMKFVHAKGDQVGFTEQEQSVLIKYGQIGNQEWHPLRLQLVGKMLLVDKISGRYSPSKLDYWQKFEERLEEKYRGVVP